MKTKDVNIYRLKKGNNIIAVGTIEEISKKTGLVRNRINQLKSKSYAKKMSNSRNENYKYVEFVRAAKPKKEFHFTRKELKKFIFDVMEWSDNSIPKGWNLDQYMDMLIATKLNKKEQLDEIH